MRTKVFKSGNSKAVRLPADISFDVGTELEITRTGDVVTMFPSSKRGLKETFELLRKMPRPTEPLGPIERTQVRLTAWDKEVEPGNRLRELAESRRKFERSSEIEEREPIEMPDREDD